jgi:two-component system OmpR family sensor kinase/two-component system sensor histidine kinase BaeS
MVWVTGCALMNKLWVRLTGAFLVVALVAVGAVAGIVNRTTASSFRSYVGQQTTANANTELIRSLEAHYTSAGSWTGAQDILATARSGHGGGQERGSGGEGPLFLLVGVDYTVVAASEPQQIGRSLSDAERDRALALVVEGQTVGYLLREGAGTQALDTAQQKFLDDVSGVLALTAVGAIILALVMGLVLAWVLVRPLSHLRQSAAAIAQGHLGTQMPVAGTTEFREVAAAFNRMSVALAESEAVRQRMTSDIAHELRSPVSVMRGQLEAMMDGVFPLNTEQLVVVYDQTLHLGRLIEDLRTLTRAEARRLPLEMTRVSPNTFAQRVVADFAPLAQEESIALNADIAPALPFIQADADRLRQILANLLANALAHTPSGGSITVKAARTETGVRFAVADTGPGLTSEQAAHVFERFYRADDARQRDRGGSGLGLAITQELVKLHGGRIWVESAPGAGSTFCFEIPAIPSDK